MGAGPHFFLPACAAPAFARGMLRRLILVLLAATTAALRAAETKDPRLAVLISVDQLRSDYLDRFRPYFGEDGFNRLLTRGAVYAEARHRHAFTNTASGHATLVTGVHANVHGIIGNEWRDGATLAEGTSVTDPEARIVGDGSDTGVRVPGGVLGTQSGISPRRLLATTIGDQLKLRQGTRAKVIGVGAKDRSSVLMAGRLADVAFWLKRGRFVTSTHYVTQAPAWAEDFNAKGRIEAEFGRTWDRLLDARIYESVQGPDNMPGEENPDGLGETFPKRIDGGQKVLSERFYEAYRLSPFSTDLVLEFARVAVRAEQLGRRDAPDLLTIGISQVDQCGHSYGPDSHEVMDSVIRLDRALAAFFQFLDQEVGAENYVVVLSADHGVAPLPERVVAQRGGVPAGRFDSAGARAAIEAALTAAFGAPDGQDYWVVRDGATFRLRRETLQSKQIDPAAARRVAKGALLGFPDIAAAFTREELAGVSDEGESLASRVRRSYHDERSGDVYFVLRPYMVDRRPKGANHNTPYDYDRHVPLVWYGAGIQPGVHLEPVGTDQLAPTLCGLLGIPRPPECTAERLF